MKGERHDNTGNPKNDELGAVSGEQTACLAVSPRLDLAHHADEEDETAMEGARAVPAPLPSPLTPRKPEAHQAAHTHHTELGARDAREEEGAMLITRPIAAELSCDRYCVS